MHPLYPIQVVKNRQNAVATEIMLFTLTKAQAYVSFNETGSTITFTPVDNPYAYYNFCNPGEMFPKLSESKSGDILLVIRYCFLGM